MIGYNSAAAMAFKDEAAASVTLSALKAKEDIVAAVLYDPHGKVFAQYVRANTAQPELPKWFHSSTAPASPATIWKCSMTSR